MSKPEFTELSYKDFKNIWECSWRYKLGKVDRIWPERTDSYFAIPGIVIQKLFELWYNNEMWRPVKGPDNILRPTDSVAKLNEMLDTVFERTITNKRNPVIWVKDGQNRMSPSEMKELIRSMIPHTLRVIKEHKLLGPFARSEVKLSAWFDKKYVLSGKADFIVKKGEAVGNRYADHLILDGKAVSKRTSTSVDPQQLRFYALVTALRENRLPTGLGFLFYRPDVAKSPEEAIDWISCTKGDVEALLSDIRDAIEVIRKKDFKPNTKACFFCDFKEVCSHYPYGKKKIEELDNAVQKGKVTEFSL